DERSEIAAKFRGVSQFTIGQHVDVMEGMPKSTAMMLMLRSMSPEILAVDEITANEDIAAMECACNCGVNLLATAHGYDLDCLATRPLYSKLRELNIFRYAVVLGIKNGEYTWQVIEL
ncbi:MAG: stage III sporulation protein AB, partial [Clostridia bacterium]